MTRRILAVVAIAASWLAAPAAAQSTPTAQAVIIPAADGGPIEADLYGTGPRGVLLLHGGRFDRSSWKPQATALVAAGFRALAIDFHSPADRRAKRDSPCGYDAVCLGRTARAAVRYLRETGATSVAIVGASLGGGAAAQAAIDAVPGEIDRVVLLAHMLVDQPERLRVPALFLVARDDANADGPRLPGIHAQYEKAAGPKELVVIDGDAHAQFLFATPQGAEVWQRVQRFLDTATPGR
jgi:pimeloyl-ACP methyl ester carboxylesterase